MKSQNFDFGTVENQIFDWDQWDDMGEGNRMFYNIVLIQLLGNFQAGTAFKQAYWCDTNSYLVLTNENEEFVFRLRITAERVM